MQASITSTVNTPQDLVVGVDGSEESFAALRWALLEASLTGQSVNAVYGWSYSWDMGPEPESEEELAQVRRDIAQRLRGWVDEASRDIDISDEQIQLTSFRASGSAALLEIGKNAEQIIVGRRSLNRVARWLMGSLSSSLAEEAQVPVTIIRTKSDEDDNIQDQIANALTPGDEQVHFETPMAPTPRLRRPIVVGVDGSQTSYRALEFAFRLASIHQAPLHVMFCWQLKDLQVLSESSHAIPAMQEAQAYAEKLVSDMIATLPEERAIEVAGNAFHISAGKGLISASRYARHIVVGSRGLSGIDAHFLGSVSKQIINLAECNITVVH